MTSTSARCDLILALIDDCLAEHDSTMPLSIDAGRAGRPRRPARRLHAVRSVR
jgi:hypothetical protein